MNSNLSVRLSVNLNYPPQMSLLYRLSRRPPRCPKCTGAQERCWNSLRLTHAINRVKKEQCSGKTNAITLKFRREQAVKWRESRRQALRCTAHLIRRLTAKLRVSQRRFHLVDKIPTWLQMDLNWQSASYLKLRVTIEVYNLFTAHIHAWKIRRTLLRPPQFRSERANIMIKGMALREILRMSSGSQAIILRCLVANRSARPHNNVLASLHLSPLRLYHDSRSLPRRLIRHGVTDKNKRHLSWTG